MIPDRWYPILESSRVRRRPVHVRRLGQDLVLWRPEPDRVVAVPRHCPHRGAGLERGRVIDGQLRCPWHGFRFDAAGTCTDIPCNLPGTRIPAGMQLQPCPTRERHGLVWLWHGEPRESYPEVPWFEGLGLGSSDSSYELPYPYSRMMETNLDLHHIPWVHGTLGQRRLGPVADPIEVELTGDRIVARMELRKPDAAHGVPFRIEAVLPSLVRLDLFSRMGIVVSATPVDATTTWLWFRYHHTYTRLPWLRTLIPWIAIQSELRWVQPQDWRIFETLPAGDLDDVPMRLVRADEPIALYRRRRAELLKPLQPVVGSGH